MSWHCLNCETENIDADDICVVCNSIPPVLSFKFGDYISGGSAKLTWEEKSHIDKLSINYKGKEFEVTGKNSYTLVIDHRDPVVFVAVNDVATRQFVLLPPPPVILARYCIVCGNFLKDGESFCMRCGGRRHRSRNPV